MKTYLRSHTLKAEPMNRGEYNVFRGRAIPPDENPADEGYKTICSVGGHVSWLPKDLFEKITTPCDHMTFGAALECLKNGYKVTRKGWNGKGMFLWLKPVTIVKAEWCKDKMLKELVEANGGEILGLGTICMYTHDGTGRKAILTGWLASQSDMLSDDWQIVE